MAITTTNKAIYKYSAQHGLNPNFVAAIGYKESGLNPSSAIGDGGRAIGAFQVHHIGATATSAIPEAIRAGYLPANAGTVEWLSDPDNNVRAACAVLAVKRDAVINDHGITDPTEAQIAHKYNGANVDTPRDYLGKNEYATSVMAMKTEIEDPATSSKYGEYDSKEGVFKYKNGGPTSPAPTEPGDITAPLLTQGKGVTAKMDMIMDFVKFASTQMFKELMKKIYRQSYESTLHGFIQSFIHRFYHIVQYIPTLPNCHAILIKPETFFTGIPTCNVIYPSIKNGMSFTRNHKAEPTRLMVTSDLIRGLFGTAGVGSVGQVNTLVFMDYDEKGKEKVIGLNVLEEAGKSVKAKPLVGCSKYEEKNGIRIRRSAGGEDVYLYMMANDIGTTSDKKNDINRYMKLEKVKLVAAAKTLTDMAKYHLLRARFEQRPGSANLFFNPYITPGFPLISIEGAHDSTINVTAYCTDVSHTLSSAGATTAIGMTGAHTKVDPQVQMMPVVEEAYSKNLGSEIKKILGDNVSLISQDGGVDAVRKDFAESKGSVRECMEKVWRPLTTFDEYCDTLANGAKAKKGEKFTVLEGSFFKKSLQETLIKYSNKIYTDREAFYETDVR